MRRESLVWLTKLDAGLQQINRNAIVKKTIEKPFRLSIVKVLVNKSNKVIKIKWIKSHNFLLNFLNLYMLKLKIFLNYIQKKKTKDMKKRKLEYYLIYLNTCRRLCCFQLHRSLWFSWLSVHLLIRSGRRAQQSSEILLLFKSQKKLRRMESTPYWFEKGIDKNKWQ